MQSLVNNTHIDKKSIEQYKAEFTNTGCVFLPGLLEHKVLQNFINKLSKTPFETKYETEQAGKFGKVLYVPPQSPVMYAFHMLFNNAELFTAIEAVTGCGQIGNFAGRIHRSEEAENHKIDWHGDNADNRLLAMTLSLGEERYTGGRFEMRKKGSSQLLREFGQLEAGDAIIFKIAPDLEHRLTELETGRRTVGVGWFRSEPDQKTFMANYLNFN